MQFVLLLKGTSIPLLMTGMLGGLVFSNFALIKKCTFNRQHNEASCILKSKLSYVTDIILQNIKLNMQIEATMCIVIN
jgi:hypothetical protein